MQTLHVFAIIVLCSTQMQRVQPQLPVLTIEIQRGEQFLNQTITKLLFHIEEAHNFTNDILQSVLNHGNTVFASTHGPIMTALQGLVSQTSNWMSRAQHISTNILPCTTGQIQVARINTRNILAEVNACIQEASQPALALSNDISALRKQAQELLNSGLSNIKSCVPEELPALAQIPTILHCVATVLKTVNYKTLCIYSSIAADRLFQIPLALSVPVAAAKCSATGTSQAVTDIGTIGQNIHDCLTSSMGSGTTDMDNNLPVV